MGTSNAKDAKTERGSAMIISVLVTAIMSLLGISYLLMADTENRIAENEKLAAQALYFGEGTVREVKRWFDRPPYGSMGTRNLVKPLTSVMDRTLRYIDVDGEGPTAAVAADGTLAKPYYKVGIDRDADGNEDIFDKPYRSALGDMLVGTEDHPDIRIDRGANSATATFLDGMADKVAPNFPAAAAGVRTRVKTIDVYGPPYLEIAGTWTRYGMATVKATVEIVRTSGSTSAVIATRVIKAVLNETPFPGPFGPLHSCHEMDFTGEFKPHWGTSTAVNDLKITTGADAKIPWSLPRDLPPSAKIDRLHGWNDNAMWDGMYKTAAGTMVGRTIDDPWYRFILDGMALKNGSTPIWTPAATPQQPFAPGTTDQDRSNLIQSFGGVGCPEFDYDTWKQIAKSGGSDVHYYAWDNGTDFLEGGTGAATDFRALTNKYPDGGLFFFDTKDGIAPHDPDANDVAVNLTPEMRISANWGVKGFMYANTANWTSQGSPGIPITMHWPSEPFRDANENGRFDTGEDFVNLNYSTISTTDPHEKPVVSRADAGGDAYGGSTMWNSKGPDITGQVAIIWGLLYVSGNFDSQGTPMYYGSVVTKAGMNNSMAGTPDLFWDTDLKDNWPPPGWDLPRVIITQWVTDL
jgi:hypothetical protein